MLFTNTWNMAVRKFSTRESTLTRMQHIAYLLNVFSYLINFLCFCLVIQFAASTAILLIYNWKFLLLRFKSSLKC